jgi:DNA-binding GntR family transcriptional regulator
VARSKRDNAPGSGARRLGHRTLAAAAADELRRRILGGEYPGDSQLRQEALSRELGISRIPLREALVQLESEGLVKIVPHRGAVVAELSVDEIEELFGLRALLEPHLLRASTPHLTAADYRALEEILSEYGEELRSRHVARWGELNTALHGLLYRRAALPRTAAIVSSLLRHAERYTRMQLAFTEALERAETEHRRIVDLCRAQRVDDAAAVLAEHIRNACTTLVAYIRTQTARSDSPDPN